MSPSRSNNVNKAVLKPQVSPTFVITYFCNHCNIRLDSIPVKVICAKRSIQGLLCPSPMKINWWPFFKNFSQKVNNPKWPLDDLWPYICWCLCVTLPRIIVLNSHRNTSKHVDTVTIKKNLMERSMTPRWPLTPLLLRPHVWLYPRIIVSKSMKIHQSMWIQSRLFLKMSHVKLYPRIIVSNILPY